MSPFCPDSFPTGTFRVKTGPRCCDKFNKLCCIKVVVHWVLRPSTITTGWTDSAWLVRTAYLWRRLLPAQQRPDRDDEGQDPDSQHGQQGPPLGDHHWVLQRIADANVAVNGDDTEWHDGCRAAQDIHCSPDVAEDSTKHPVTQNLETSKFTE